MLPSFYFSQQNTRTQNGKAALNLLIFAAILIIGLIYLWQVNSLVSYGYKLRSFQKELKLIQEENKRIKLDITQSQSLAVLQEAVRDFNMVSADTISYLEKPKPKVVTTQAIKQP